MKVKLTDQLHDSQLGPDTVPAGTEVEVSEATGAEWVKRGLATKVGGGTKQAAAPKNKKAAAPRNKAR